LSYRYSPVGQVSDSVTRQEELRIVGLRYR